MQVDVVIVNCSLFNPTPSLSAMVVNHFGMRPDIKSYNLSGMGCSAGIISIGLARELLQASTLGLLHACTVCLHSHSAARQPQCSHTLFSRATAAERCVPVPWFLLQ